MRSTGTGSYTSQEEQDEENEGVRQIIFNSHGPLARPETCRDDFETGLLTARMISKATGSPRERWIAEQQLLFGQYIKERRKGQGLDRQAAADKAGIVEEEWFRLERGLLNRNETESLLEKIAIPLLIAPNELRKRLYQDYPTLQETQKPYEDHLTQPAHPLADYHHRGHRQHH